MRLAHPGAALRVELAKLGEQLTIRVLLGVCLVGPIGFALVMRVQSTVPADTLFGRWARTTGFATSLTILSFATTFGLPLVAGILAGDVFSSEDRHDTWKTVLTRSVTRADVFLGKTLATFLYAALLVAVLALSSLLSGVLLVGSDPLVGLTGQLVSGGRASWLVLLSWAFSLLPMLVFVSLGLLLSLVSRSAIVGVLGPGLVGLVLQLLALVGSGEIERAILPGTPLDAWHGLFVDPVHVGPLVQGAITCLVYVAIFLILAWYVLQRRAFAAAEAVPQRRWRVPVRAAVASAVVAGRARAGGRARADQPDVDPPRGRHHADVRAARLAAVRVADAQRRTVGLARRGAHVVPPHRRREERAGRGLVVRRAGDPPEAAAGRHQHRHHGGEQHPDAGRQRQGERLLHGGRAARGHRSGDPDRRPRHDLRQPARDVRRLLRNRLSGHAPLTTEDRPSPTPEAPGSRCARARSSAPPARRRPAGRYTTVASKLHYTAATAGVRST